MCVSLFQHHELCVLFAYFMSNYSSVSCLSVSDISSSYLLCSLTFQINVDSLKTGFQPIYIQTKHSQPEMFLSLMTADSFTLLTGNKHSYSSCLWKIKSDFLSQWRKIYGFKISDLNQFNRK